MRSIALQSRSIVLQTPLSECRRWIIPLYQVIVADTGVRILRRAPHVSAVSSPFPRPYLALCIP